MRIFYGAAVQGEKTMGQRAHVHSYIIEAIKALGHEVVAEHTAGTERSEIIQKMEQALGKLPREKRERVIYVRNKLIEELEGDIAAAIFEVSIPSLGTGVEITHVYLRPRLGRPPVPILLLFEKGAWKNGLSTMLTGITPDAVQEFHIEEYEKLEDVSTLIRTFLDEST